MIWNKLAFYFIILIRINLFCYNLIAMWLNVLCYFSFCFALQYSRLFAVFHFLFFHFRWQFEAFDFRFHFIVMLNKRVRFGSYWSFITYIWMTTSPKGCSYWFFHQEIYMELLAEISNSNLTGKHFSYNSYFKLQRKSNWTLNRFNNFL